MFDDATAAHNSLEAAGEGKAGGWAFAETNVGQWAIYAQDEWNVNDNFKLTYVGRKIPARDSEFEATCCRSNRAAQYEDCDDQHIVIPENLHPYLLTPARPSLR